MSVGNLGQARSWLNRTASSRVAENILANYLSAFWLGGLSIALIPFYLKRLGPEQWGVVAVCLAIQGFMGLLDAGLGQIMPRDVARVAGQRAAEAHVFRTFALAYISLGVVGLLVGQLSVPWLVEHWINQDGGLQGLELALRLVLVQFFFQFANNAHIGYWNGIQEQKLANLRTCSFHTARHAGAVILVLVWKATEVAYLLPFVIMSALEWWSNRRRINREFATIDGDVIKATDLLKLAKETGVLALAVVIGMLVSQIDRIVLSRTVDVSAFGRYIIVANLGVALMQLQYPIMRAFLPRVVSADRSQGNSLQWQLLRATLLLCVVPCAVAILIAPWLLRSWLGDSETARLGVLPLRLIISAVAINSIYNIVYQRILVANRLTVLIVINITCLILVTPIAAFTAQRYGIAAGGLAWMLNAVIQLSLGMTWALTKLRSHQR